MRRTRLFIMLIIVSAFIGSISNAEETGFSDMSNHWAEPVILEWAEDALITGYPDGSFRPDTTVTKAEYITMVNRIYGYYVKGEENYEDVLSEDWFAQNTAIALNSGYMDWYSSATLEPNKAVTRQEVCAILASVMMMESYEDLSVLNDFADHSSIPEWARPYMAAVVSESYMNGYPDHTIRPQGEITRAEAVVMLDRVLGMLINDEVMSKTVDPVEGNLTISVGDVILKDMTVQGDLMIAAGVGDGDAVLDNVEVIGRTIIQGGGENSVKLINCRLGQVVVHRVGGSVRIVSTGSQLGDVAMKSPGKLEGDFADAEIHVLVNGMVLEGSFKHVIVDPLIDIEITSDSEVEKIVGSIAELTENALQDVSTGGGGTPSVTQSSACDVVSSAVGVLTNNKISAVPWNTTIDALKSGLTVSEKAVFSVKIGTEEVIDGSAMPSTEMSIEVIAESGAVKTYAIEILLPEVGDITVYEDFIFTDEDAADIVNNKQLANIDFKLTLDGAIDTESFTLYGVSSLSAISEGDVVYVYEGDRYIRMVVVGPGVKVGELTRISSGYDQFDIGGSRHRTADPVGMIEDVNIRDWVAAKFDGLGNIYEMRVVEAKMEVTSSSGLVINYGSDDNGEYFEFEGNAHIVVDGAVIQDTKAYIQSHVDCIEWDRVRGAYEYYGLTYREVEESGTQAVRFYDVLYDDGLYDVLVFEK